MTVSITNNERRMISVIAHDEMSRVNGSPEDADSKDDLDTYVNVPDWARECCLSQDQAKGVLSSLVKKELVFIQGYDKDLNLVYFSDEGYSIVKELLAE